MQKKYTLEDLLYNKFSIFFISTLLLLSNCYLGNNAIVKVIQQFTGLAFCLIFFFIYIIFDRYNKTIIFFILYCVLLIVSCIHGQYSNINHFFITYSNIIAISLYLEMGLKRRCRDIIQIINNIYFCLIIINFLTIILFPNGLYSDSLYSNNWFFKYDNMHIYMYIPAIILNYLSSQYDGKLGFKSIIMHAIILFCILYCKSATSLVAYSLLVFYFFFKKRIDKVKIFNIKSYFSFYILIFIFIVILRIQNLFAWFIVGILHKNLTFTTRTDLWDTIIEYIKEKPILGYGIEETNIFRTKMGGIFYTHAHNTILDILYKGGIVSLAFHFGMLFDTVKKIFKEKNTIAKTIAFIMLSVFVTLNFEAREEKMGFYIIIIIASNIKYILESLQRGFNYEK